MNWDAVAAIAESLGALGVIVTLGYLAVQIRTGSSVLKTSNYMELNHLATTFTAQLAGDPELLSIFLRGQESYVRLSKEEQGRFHMLMSNMINPHETAHRLRERGHIDSELHDEMFESISMLFAAPGVREWWLENGKWLAPSFQDAVEAKMSSRPAQENAESGDGSST
jgi:hypothetical protein